ncbi:dTDP-4-dehydrorhamnose 3,5-epimerase family protein [Pigmentibacter ruber]
MNNNFTDSFNIINNYKSKKFTDNRGSLDIIYEGIMVNDPISLKRSYSKPYVFRGLHLQLPNSPQRKIIEVLKGEIIDICVNFNKNSKNFGKILTQKISSEDFISYEIPHSYAHGFIALTDVTFQYLCIGNYSAEHELSISPPTDFFKDLELNQENIIISPKDLSSIKFEEALNNAMKYDWN